MDATPQEHPMAAGNGSGERAPDQNATMTSPTQVSTYHITQTTFLYGFNEEILSLRARLQAQEQRLEMQDAKSRLQEQQQATAITNSHSQITEYLYKEILKLHEHITQCNSKIVGLEQSLLKSRRDVKEYSRRLKHLMEQRHRDKAQTLEAVRREVAYTLHKEARGVGAAAGNETADTRDEVNEKSMTLENSYYKEEVEDEEVEAE